MPSPDSIMPKTAAAAPPAPPPRKKVLIVDELTERTISVLHSSVVFRPGQVLTDPYAIQLAREHNIQTRER